MKSLKLLTGTTFALLLTAVCLPPTMAQTTSSPGDTPGETRPEQENDDSIQSLPGETDTTGPEFEQQNSPSSPTNNNQLQQNNRPGAAGQGTIMQRTTGQDSNNAQPMTGQNEQFDQQNQNIRQRTVQEQQMQRRTTTVENQQPSDFNQPAAETQTETAPTTNVQGDQPVRALW